MFILEGLCSDLLISAQRVNTDVFLTPFSNKYHIYIYQGFIWLLMGEKVVLGFCTLQQQNTYMAGFTQCGE